MTACIVQSAPVGKVVQLLIQQSHQIQGESALVPGVGEHSNAMRMWKRGTLGNEWGIHSCPQNGHVGFFVCHAERMEGS